MRYASRCDYGHNSVVSTKTIATEIFARQKIRAKVE